MPTNLLVNLYYFVLVQTGLLLGLPSADLHRGGLHVGADVRSSSEAGRCMLVGLQPLPPQPAGPHHAGLRSGLGHTMPAAGHHLPLPLQSARRRHEPQGQSSLRLG